MKDHPSHEAPRKRLGRQGEDLAQVVLKKKGYKILERNFTSPLGEIDIVAKEGKTLVFIEVKSRLSSIFGPAKGAVTPRKQRKLSMVALDYLKQKALMNQAARFDVVAIDWTDQGPQVELIRNAFDLAY